jgi:archaellum component FlaC
LVEGEEAVELYTRQIVFNLTELEKQVEELREACARTKKLLRDVA